MAQLRLREESGSSFGRRSEHASASNGAWCPEVGPLENGTVFLVVSLSTPKQHVGTSKKRDTPTWVCLVWRVLTFGGF